ncbi:hypothetical protein HPB51_021095 [Rhipicephalus microplus]|uniref:Uncharacterized protein n=1 Tax=Rhipicephalus microplus TaxID=6941 RepID=A0A9J6EIA4_RHIMP|nr:hypothetical protein HPB51_021095 [Rhipicephalus microplus]
MVGRHRGACNPSAGVRSAPPLSRETRTSLWHGGGIGGERSHKVEDTRSRHSRCEESLRRQGKLAVNSSKDNIRAEQVPRRRAVTRESLGRGGGNPCRATGFRRRGPLWRFPADRAKGDDAYRAAASPAGPPLRVQWFALWRGAGPAASPLSGRHLRRRPGLCGGIGAARRRRATCARLSPPVTSSKHVLSACHVPVSVAAEAVALSPLSFCAKESAVYAPHSRLAESGR